MNERKNRQRHKRAENPEPMVLTERDRDIIEAVHNFRVLRQDQITKLLFADAQTATAAKNAAQRRLVKLYDHAYLERRFLPVLEGAGRSPTLYVLDKKGAELLRAERGYDELVWYSSTKQLGLEFLEHTMGINDFRIAVTLAYKKHGFQLLVWKDENAVKADIDRVTVRLPNGKSQPLPIVPDSYFVMDMGQGNKHFFLELDRGTMTLDRFKSKILGYIAYHKSGQYEKRYQTKSMRVLTVTLGDKRLASLKETAESAGAERRYWFCTAEQITVETALTETIWQVASSQEKVAITANF